MGVERKCFIYCKEPLENNLVLLILAATVFVCSINIMTLSTLIGINTIIEIIRDKIELMEVLFRIAGFILGYMVISIIFLSFILFPLYNKRCLS